MVKDSSALLMSDAIAIEEKSIWLLSLEKMMLIRINRESGSIDKVKVIPNEINQNIPYRFIFFYNYFIYLLPYEEKHFLKYDIMIDQFSYIEYDKGYFDENCYMSSYVIIDNYAVISGSTSKVAILNLQTDTIKVVDISKKIPANICITYWVWRYSYKRETKVCFVPLNSPYFIELDIYTEDVTIHNIEESRCSCFDNSVFVENKLYYFDRKEYGSCINEYDIDTKTHKKISGMEKIERDDYRIFGFIANSDDFIVVFPGINDRGYVLDLNTEQILELKDLPRIDRNELGHVYPYEFNYRNGICTSDGKIVLVHAWSQQIVEYNAKTRELKTTNIKDDEINWNDVFMKEIQEYHKKDIIKEWKVGMLDRYLDFVQQLD